MMMSGLIYHQQCSFQTRVESRAYYVISVDTWIRGLYPGLVTDVDWIFTLAGWNFQCMRSLVSCYISTESHSSQNESHLTRPSFTREIKRTRWFWNAPNDVTRSSTWPEKQPMGPHREILTLIASVQSITTDAKSLYWCNAAPVSIWVWRPNHGELIRLGNPLDPKLIRAKVRTFEWTWTCVFSGPTIFATLLKRVNQLVHKEKEPDKRERSRSSSCSSSFESINHKLTRQLLH